MTYNHISTRHGKEVLIKNKAKYWTTASNLYVIPKLTLRISCLYWWRLSFHFYTLKDEDCSQPLPVWDCEGIPYQNENLTLWCWMYSLKAQRRLLKCLIKHETNSFDLIIETFSFCYVQVTMLLWDYSAQITEIWFEFVTCYCSLLFPHLSQNYKEKRLQFGIRASAGITVSAAGSITTILSVKAQA